MKINYEEGTLFAVPLEYGVFAVGVVARTTTKGKVILVYLFCKLYHNVPRLCELEYINPKDACKVIRIGDLGLINKKWPVIGKVKNWDRTEWPVPTFIRREDISGRAWKVQYSDNDPNKLESEVAISYSEIMERDGVFGYEAVEIVLKKLLMMPKSK